MDVPIASFESVEVPDWLLAPPQGLQRTQSPVVTRAQGLPFQELDWKNFERLVLRIVRSDSEITACHMYGVPGQDQHGIDLLAKSSSGLVCYQCKRVKDFAAADVTAAVKKFEDGKWAAEAKTLTLCTSSPLESVGVVERITQERERLATKGVAFQVWDGSQASLLTEQLKNMPKLVDDFFGREWVKQFNGEAASATLGAQLDGIDFDQLRRRLGQLYSTIFAQHDPGIGRPSTRGYETRFVPMDLLETRSFEVARSGSQTRQPVREVGDQGHAPTVERPGNAGDVEQVASRIPALQWIRQQDSCCILGEAGQGKSMLLRYLALVLGNGSTDQSSPVSPRHLDALPVWISFARFASAIERHAGTSVQQFFESWLEQTGYSDLRPLFLRALQHSKLVLLLDGLDEGTTLASMREAVDRIVTFAQARNAVVICSGRPRGFRALALPPWARATLAPFNDSQITQLATRWFGELENPQEHGHISAPLRSEEFLEAIRRNRRTHELARTPLLCQALLELFWSSHQLPEGRARAYAEIIHLFLRRHPDARAHAGFVAGAAGEGVVRVNDYQQILTRIATDTQFRGGGGVAPRARCVELCADYLEDDVDGLGLPHAVARRTADDLITHFVERLGILVERAPSELSFVHLSLQEFLTAEGLANRPDQEQLDWLATVALDARWRECVISWFALQGERGTKALAARGSRRVADIGQTGEWERIEVLRLRTQLACAELGLPVSEARVIVEEAVREVERSPFASVRAGLAEDIANGALGGTTVAECRAAIARWTPGIKDYERAHILRAFRDWSPSDDLEAAFKRALHGEAFDCRRVAAEQFAHIYRAEPTALTYLSTLARSHPDAPLRATALYGLLSREEWNETTRAIASDNKDSVHPEMVLARMHVRVKLSLQSKDDWKEVYDLWASDRLGFGRDDELGALLFAGWPAQPELRELCEHVVKQGGGTANYGLPYAYLLRAWPQDDAVATLLREHFLRYKFHGFLDSRSFWQIVRRNFQGNEIVADGLRSALQHQREHYAAIRWDPTTVPAYMVLGDDQARDELIAGYVDAGDDWGRYWIAHALHEQWASDPVAQRAFAEWAAGSANLAAPLAPFASMLFPDAAVRLSWLERLVREADARIAKLPIQQLLEERPDATTRVIVRDAMRNKHFWYYHRIALESELVAAFPTDADSLETVRVAFEQIDGPSIGAFAGVFEHDASIRARLLAFAAPAGFEVRYAIAAVLQRRASDDASLDAVTQTAFAESNGAARAATLIARARAARYDPEARAALSKVLTKEADANGSDLQLRRRTAWAALLELGEGAALADVIATQSPSLRAEFIDSINPDPVSLEVVLKHWSVLDRELRRHGTALTLPVESIVNAGFGGLLEYGDELRTRLDQWLVAWKRGDGWRYSGKQLQLLAQRFPRSALLRDTLLRELMRHPGIVFDHSDSDCCAARLLAEHFGGDVEVLKQLEWDGGLRVEASSHGGVFGYLNIGWPQAEYFRESRAVEPSARSSWPARDQVLCAIAWGEAPAAKEAVLELAEVGRHVRGGAEEDAAVFARWVNAPGVADVVAAWQASNDPREALLGLRAVSLIEKESLDSSQSWIRHAFNEAYARGATVPPDAVDPLSGRVRSWLDCAYETMAHL